MNEDITGAEGVTDVNAGETSGTYAEGTVTAEAPEGQPDENPNSGDTPAEPSPDPAPDPEPATEGDAPEAEAVDPDRAEQVRIQNTSIDPSTGSTMQAEGRQPLGISPSE